MLEKLKQLLPARDAVPTAGPIGIEFARETLHMVQLRAGRDDTIECVSRVSIDYPSNREHTLDDPAATRALLKKALAAGDFQGRSVVPALPPHRVRIMSVNYKLGASEDHAGMILKMMRQRMGSDMQDHVIDFIHVRSQDLSDERLAVVALAEERAVNSFLDNIRSAGLTPLALEVNPLAIKRVVVQLIHTHQTDTSNSLAINFGEHGSYLTVISGRRLLSDQPTAFAEDDIVTELAKDLNVEPAQARQWIARYGLRGSEGLPATDGGGEIASIIVQIARRNLTRLIAEIERSEIYVASETRGGTVSAIFLLGGMARWPGVETLIGSMTGIPVKILDPRAVYGDHSQPPYPSATVATGLALRPFQV